MVLLKPLFGADHAAQGSKLTLDAAISEALASSPSLSIVDAEVDYARGEVLTAKTRANPELTFSPGIRRLNEGDASHREFLGSLELNQTFLFPGKRELLVAVAERNVELRKLGLEGIRFQLNAAVRKTFYELLAAQEIVDLRRQQLESAQTFQKAAEKRVECGYGSDFEAVKSQREVILAKKTLAEAEGNIASARVELNALLGRNPAAPLEVEGLLNESKPTPPMGDLVAQAMSSNPSLRVQAMQAEIAELNIRKARLARRPDFSAGPTVSFSKSEQILGLSASIPLPSKNYGRGEIQSAKAEQRRVAAEMEVLKREIASSVVKAATQLATARSQLALYSPNYLGQLKAAVDQAERSYAQNATSLIIYLDAKRAYFDTLADYYEAIANAASSQASLDAAVGATIEAPVLKTAP